MLKSHERIVAIEKGDMYETYNPTYLIVPKSIDIKEEKKKWWHWYNKEVEYMHFSDWLMKLDGVRYPKDDELETITDEC